MQKENIELVAFAETQTIEIKTDFINGLSDKVKAKFYYNLAKTLVEKINIGNKHLYIRGITTVSLKLVEYLTEIRKDPVWLRVVSSQSINSYELNIIWSVNKLSQYLSCARRGLKTALKEFVELQAGELIWFDSNFDEINDVTIDEIKKLNNQNNRLKYDTKFKITKIDRNNLRDLVGQRE